jgi:hypothetical protein
MNKSEQVFGGPVHVLSSIAVERTFRNSDIFPACSPINRPITRFRPPGPSQFVGEQNL